jgi:hypothetical protein
VLEVPRTSLPAWQAYRGASIPVRRWRRFFTARRVWPACLAWSEGDLGCGPKAVCAACALRAQCTTATHGQGRRVSIREDEPFQQKLRAKMKTPRGRASLRKRTAVEHAMAHQLAHQGRRARAKACARTSLMAVVMRRSVTSRSRHVIRSTIEAEEASRPRQGQPPRNSRRLQLSARRLCIGPLAALGTDSAVMRRGVSQPIRPELQASRSSGRISL